MSEPAKGRCGDINCRCHITSGIGQSWRVGGANTAEIGKDADMKRAHAAKLRREARARKRGKG